MTRGFTLLELLIALGIFSLLSVMAYGGLKVVLSAREQTAAQSERLARLERAVLFLGRDIVQAVDRPVRDALGDPLPALTGGEGAGVELTRSGWSDPAGTQRSALRRVAWVLDGRALVRKTWPVLDRAQASEPYPVNMLEGVQALKWGFLTAEGDWIDDWPPEESTSALPRAIRTACCWTAKNWSTTISSEQIGGSKRTAT